MEHLELTPEDVGLPRCAVEDLQGSTGEENADIVRRLLRGEHGPVRHAVLLNAAAGLTALDEDAGSPLLQRLERNIDRAAQSLDSGAAADVLQRWTEFSAAS